MALAELRILAHRQQIRAIHLEDNFVVFTYASRRLMQTLASRPGVDLRIVDDRSAYFPFERAEIRDDALLALVKSVLRP